MAEHYLYGTQPYLTNPPRVLLVKMLNALGGGASTSGSPIAYYEGAGSPVGVFTPNNPNGPAMYRDTNLQTIYWWDVTSQTWV